MSAGVRQVTGVVLSRVYRTAMRRCAGLVHDIDVARRHGSPSPGDPGLRELMLRQAIAWRDRSAAAGNWRVL